MDIEYLKGCYKKWRGSHRELSFRLGWARGDQIFLGHFNLNTLGPTKDV